MEIIDSVGSQGTVKTQNTQQEVKSFDETFPNDIPDPVPNGNLCPYGYYRDLFGNCYSKFSSFA